MLENVYCSVDRLTILGSNGSASSVLFIRKLENLLFDYLLDYDDLEIANYRDVFSFGINKIKSVGRNERVENIFFIQDFGYGSNGGVRIDFNPNTLAKYNAEHVWDVLKMQLFISGYELRLSRFDLAFDIINAPYIQKLESIRGGISKKTFYGRSGAVETIYWGSKASNVQVRLYDKIVESKGKIDELYNAHSELRKTDDNGRYLVQIHSAWRLEMQMRTKVIDENLAQEVMKRLDEFVLVSPYALDLKPDLKAFAKMFLESPDDLKLAYGHISERTLRYWKAKVRKAVRDTDNDIAESIKKALQRDSEKLNKSLMKYCKVYLGF